MAGDLLKPIGITAGLVALIVFAPTLLASQFALIPLFKNPITFFIILIGVLFLLSGRRK